MEIYVIIKLRGHTCQARPKLLIYKAPPGKGRQKDDAKK
jgi:hypothetical protein